MLLVGHGSRDPAANVEFEAVAAAYRAAHPELRVEIGYIELARPLLGEALEATTRAAERVVVVPLFLFAAGHVKNDVPQLVAESRRHARSTQIVVARHLGVHPGLVTLAWDRVQAVLAGGAARDRTLLLVVGRGSSDPDANGDLCKVARLIGEGRGLMHVDPTFIGITTPLVPASLDLVARIGPERLVVLPYMLFAGVLVARLAKQVAAFAERHPEIHASVAPHLGGDERVLALIDERVRQAVAGEAPLPCDTCQYRTPSTAKHALPQPTLPAV